MCYLFLWSREVIKLQMSLGTVQSLGDSPDREMGTRIE